MFEQKCQQLQHDTRGHNQDAPRTRPKDAPGDSQETPGDHQEATRNTAGNPKASQMIPQRLSGTSQKPLWKDVSFMSVESVDPPKVLQIAFKTGLALMRRASNDAQETPKGILETAINPKELPGNDQVASRTPQTAPKSPQHGPRAT